jgi:hypothetical protein
VTQLVTVLFCCMFALITGVSLFRASKTERISSRGWTFNRAESPVGFWFVAAIDVIILIGSLLVALQALGLVTVFPIAIRV